MEFSYFGDKAEALKEDVQLQDWFLRLSIKEDLTNELTVASKSKEIALQCDVKLVSK